MNVIEVNTTTWHQKVDVVFNAKIDVAFTTAQYLMSSTIERAIHDGARKKLQVEQIECFHFQRESGQLYSFDRVRVGILRR